MAICLKCGAQLPDDSKFCTTCGAPMETPAPEVTSEVTPEVASEVTPEVTPEAASEPTPAPTPAPSPAVTPEPTKAVPPTPTRGGLFPALGTGAFFGMLLVFMLPVIGFIVSIVLTFAAKNRNLRNFSRAVLIWYLIGIVLTVALAVTLYFILLPFVEELIDTYGGDIGSYLEELFEEVLPRVSDGYGYSFLA